AEDIEQRDQRLRMAKAEARRKQLKAFFQEWWDHKLSQDDRESLTLASQLYSNLGACHVMKEEWELAVQATTNAVELQPHFVRALLRRANANRHLDRYEEAIADVQMALEYEPNNSTAREMMRTLP